MLEQARKSAAKAKTKGIYSFRSKRQAQRQKLKQRYTPITYKR
jgi:hypothetical protein